MELKKLTKEDIDKVRHIDGFPIAKDEDIIALSNAPYYTACPNPFIEDFIKEYGKQYDEETDDYHCEPFASDVSEGKNDPIYNAHSYHTKVPYKAIMKYILHYTKPGDIVFDGFAGTGMTGVAAQKCGSPDLEYKYSVEKEFGNVEWGTRKAILNDLSSAASFISYNYNNEVDIQEYKKRANKILSECRREFDWVYKTNHVDSNGKTVMNLNGVVEGEINYVVWSDVLICPSCSKEIIFWDVAVDKETEKVTEKFECNFCNAELTKKDCETAKTILHVVDQEEPISIIKQVPVSINYFVGTKRYKKVLDEEDLLLIEKIDKQKITYWYPTERMCIGSESRRNDKNGLTHVNHFYTKRNLYAISSFLNKCSSNDRIDHMLKNTLQSCLFHLSKLNRKVPGGIGRHLSGTLYLPSLSCEVSFFSMIERKINDFVESASISNFSTNDCIVTQNSLTNVSNIPSSSIDYIFTDPPFGDNLSYSELSYIWEAWLKSFTNNKSEAIVNNSHGKSLLDYQNMMTDCFREYYRVLKPGRWITVEFHNSKNAVWNSIQTSLQHANFIVADVRTLDKQQGSFKQVNNSSAVKQDLIISAYKPKENFERDFKTHAGTKETAWYFVSQHLDKLPKVVVKEGKIEVVVERQPYLLFDRMIAYHIMNGITVPIDATEFYTGLDEKYLKRDGMYFLPDQVNEYDIARIINELEPTQFDWFVTNEKSAIAWLYRQLEFPQTYAEIMPKFMQEIKAWDKFEKRPELSTLLEENFLQNEDGKWYVPDVTKAADVIKLREKKLLKEFEGYLASKGKLKLFRAEVVRVGFAKLWTDKNYKLIVETADRLPESVIQEDDKLLMYYDISLGRI